jgi:DNA uptake protein ComE-like DNA-binding protein
MEKSFRQILREYFSFSKKDRNAVLVLAAGIILFIAATLIVRNTTLKPDSDFSEFIKILEAWEIQPENSSVSKRLFRFNPNTISEEALDSLNLPVFVKRNILSYRAAGGKFNTANDLRRIYGMNDSIFSAIEHFIHLPLLPQKKPEATEKKGKEIKVTQQPFDPNTVSENELLSAGFSPFQTSNLLKYRENGGSFASPADLLKIYGIDSVFFSSVEQFITIAEKPEKNVIDKKEALPLLLELNSTDTVELQKLKGIGPAFATRILKYRDLLGGFSRKNQLLEVYGFPEETFQNIEENIVIDSLKVSKLRINFASYGELLRHPYLKKGQVEAILNYRDRKGPFSSNGQLLTAGLVDTATFTVLRPYITCR